MSQKDRGEGENLSAVPLKPPTACIGGIEIEQEKKMKKNEMIRLAEEKYSKGDSLFDGGYCQITTIKEGDDFIVYRVELKNCNRGGIRNSGITIREGTFAFNGECELEIKPISLWRDGENQHNDRPWLCFSIMEINGNEIAMKNFHNSEVEVYLINFISKEVSLIKKTSYCNWISENAKTKEDFFNLLCVSVSEIMQRSNPRGSNSESIYTIRTGKSREVEGCFKGIQRNELELDEQIIFVGEQCLYGEPVCYRIFTGKLGQKARQIGGFYAKKGVTEIKIFPEEKKVKYLKYEKNVEIVLAEVCF